MTDTCPHCRSEARAVPYYDRAGNAVKRAFDGGVHEGELVCDACGAPRGVAGAGATGSEAAAGYATAVRSAAMARSSAGGLRALGIASVGLGVLFAMALAASGGASAVVAAIAALAVGCGVGGWSFATASRRLTFSRDLARRAGEQALLAEAAASGCTLTATEAARALGIGVEEADRALAAMADGARISAEVDDEGIVRYDFRELRVALAERLPEPVRVAIEPAGDAEARPAPADPSGRRTGQD